MQNLVLYTYRQVPDTYRNSYFRLPFHFKLPSDFYNFAADLDLDLNLDLDVNLNLLSLITALLVLTNPLLGSNRPETAIHRMLHRVGNFN